MRQFLLLASLTLVAPNAFALDPPKTAVTYSLSCSDGGAFISQILTFLLDDNDRFEMCVESGVQTNAQVSVDAPQLVTIEYSADPDTGEVIDGPAELTRLHLRQVFGFFALDGLATVHTDRTVEDVSVVSGALAGEVLTWVEPAVLETALTGSRDCFGNATICAFSAPPGGWPHFIDRERQSLTLPIFSVHTSAVRGDRFWSDNLTPEDETDDILILDDPQVTIANTWHGVEIERVFVPEPGEIALLATGLVGLSSIASRKRARARDRWRRG